MDFNVIWQLLLQNGASPKKEEGTRRYWQNLSDDKQQAAFNNISRKLAAQDFVHYDPIRAIKENSWQAPKPQTLSFNDYYAKFGTTEEQNGWRRVFIPNQQKTIYIKN